MYNRGVFRSTMPTTFQPGSFVPKEPLNAPSSGKQKKRRGSVDIIKMVSFGIFFIAIALSVGVFAYDKYTESRIASQESELESVQKSLNDGLIKTLIRFDTRLREGKRLMDNHIVLSPFFDELERTTLQSVQFTSLSVGENEDGEMVAELSGLTRSYTEVALQSDSFGQSEFLLDPIVSNFDLDLEGNVTFTFTMKLDPSLIRYRSLVQ